MSYGRWNHRWIGERGPRKWRKIKEQIRLAMEWVATSKGRGQTMWIVPPGAEKGHRKEPLARARRLVAGELKQCLEVEEDLDRGGGNKVEGVAGGRKAEREARGGMRTAGSQGRRRTDGWNKRRTEKG